MQKSSVFVLLAMVVLASSIPLRDPLIITLGNQMDLINAMDWETIDALIDNQKTILAEKKVFVNGQEVSNDFAFKLIENLSAIDWSHAHEILFNHKKMVENEVAGHRKNPAIVAKALEHTVRLKGVDWQIYSQKFGDNYMTTAAAKMSPIQVQTLKTTKGLVRLNGMKKVHFDPR